MSRGPRTTKTVAAKGAKTPPHAAWVLLTSILASSLSFIDGTVVNVALPILGGDLHARAADLQWVVNIYTLPLSCLLLLGGAAGDRFGRVLLLVIGTALFAAASLLCALAPSLPALLLGRALQGVGSALLMPNSLAILSDNFTGEARGRAVGLWAAISAGMAAIGPVLGGWLIDVAGWRSIFLINLPLAAGAILLALVFVRSVKADKPAPLDIAGALLAAGALGAIIYALTEGAGPGGWTIHALAAMAAGLILAAAFLAVEHRLGEKAMIPLHLFGSAQFAGLSIFTLLLYAALAAVMLLMPYVLIRYSHYSASLAGSALAPFAVLLALISPLTGQLAGKIGSRLLLTIGPVVMAGGLLLLLRIDAHASYWTVVTPANLVMAAGMACCAAPLTTAVLSSVDKAHTGSASGLNSALARIGGAIAAALLGQVLAAQGDALADGFRKVVLVCAGACLASSLSALLLVRREAKPEA
jgi:EmrB/QacA subfamily drug resistance transporter